MKYYINTRDFSVMMFYELRDPNNVPSKQAQIKYAVKECTEFEYYLFKVTRINLKAINRYAWFRRKVENDAAFLSGRVRNIVLRGLKAGSRIFGRSG